MPTGKLGSSDCGGLRRSERLKNSRGSTGAHESLHTTGSPFQGSRRKRRRRNKANSRSRACWRLALAWLHLGLLCTLIAASVWILHAASCVPRLFDACCPDPCRPTDPNTTPLEGSCTAHFIDDFKTVHSDFAAMAGAARTFKRLDLAISSIKRALRSLPLLSENVNLKSGGDSRSPKELKFAAAMCEDSASHTLVISGEAHVILTKVLLKTQTNLWDLEHRFGAIPANRSSLVACSLSVAHTIAPSLTLWVANFLLSGFLIRDFLPFQHLAVLRLSDHFVASRSAAAQIDALFDALDGRLANLTFCLSHLSNLGGARTVESQLSLLLWVKGQARSFATRWHDFATRWNHSAHLGKSNAQERFMPSLGRAGLLPAKQPPSAIEVLNSTASDVSEAFRNVRMLSSRLSELHTRILGTCSTSNLTCHQETRADTNLLGVRAPLSMVNFLARAVSQLKTLLRYRSCSHSPRRANLHSQDQMMKALAALVQQARLADRELAGSWNDFTHAEMRRHEM